MPQKLRLGVMTRLGHEIEEEIANVRHFGLPTCQVAAWELDHYSKENTDRIRRACDEHGVEVTTIWAGCPGPAVWNFVDGPATIGLVPPEYREMRVAALIAGAEFAAGLGVASITTHAGFLPENPKDPLYEGTVEALAKVAQHCRRLGLRFCFETGQETPITLLRVMTDIGTDNLGVNLDPANLLMYGKANPIDALDILGPYVRGVHAKDGEYPTVPGELGVEKPLGEGRVDFPKFVAKLKSFGYNGALTIEREISGPQQVADIKRAIEVLKPLC
jgi:L-ribulose-5-phosphate 3-epimerase